MTAAEIRKQFLEFFRERGHTIVPSAPVVPQDDPTLLFTNAGMNQFKPYFLGIQKPPYLRAADTQKCIRVSGKHNDLEEVGHSPYHHTFFEMLGNWSFGDYFKKESLRWGWELLTEKFKLPKDKLYATVYETDDEAEKLWKSETDIIPSHVLRFGKKDNWWSMGDTGPCGPCSEIHIDRGQEYDSDPNAFVNTGSPRYIELWNHVFIQFDAQKDGSLVQLPAKHVDTGAGLERLTTVLGNYRSNYDTDLFQPIIQAVAEYTNKPYSNDNSGMPHRVIADHLRCLTFAIGDGAIPGNEGRGYVLRRILRRAARFGRKLDVHEPFIYKFVPVLVDLMGQQFPEIKERHVHITRVIEAEEVSFGKTLDRGLERFDEVVAQVRKAKSDVIPGEDVFKLYDSFGFPLDLMQLMARENNLSVDEAGFEKAMEGQRQKARSAGKFKVGEFDSILARSVKKTDFVGYNDLELVEEDNEFFMETPGEAGPFSIVPRHTPFYVESGGQVSDSGTVVIENEFGKFPFDVIGLRRESNATVHRLSPKDSKQYDSVVKELLDQEFLRFAKGKAILQVDLRHRIPTQYNHTATHLLHAALRKTLGEHVHQAGSYVGPDYLRFDYTHFEKPSLDEVHRIETQVNDWIRENYQVTPINTSLKEAQALGAMALFGEKYGDDVRMIEIAEGEKIVSRELCGGCHVKRTGDIGVFVIRAETSAAAGVRRIDALTGDVALKYLLDKRQKVEDFVTELGSEGSDPLEKLRKALDEKKKLQKELEQLRGKASANEMSDLASNAIQAGKVNLVASIVTADNMDQMKEMGDALRDNLGSGVGVLVSIFDGKPSMVVVVTPDLVKLGVDAVPIVKELGKRLQGGGGGKPHLATAGGKNPDGMKDVIADAPSVIREISEKSMATI